MKTKFKLSNRILSLLLAFVMVVGLLPMTAYAASPVSDTSGLYTLTITDYFTVSSITENTRYKNLDSVSIENITLMENGNIECKFIIYIKNDGGALASTNTITVTFHNSSCSQTMRESFTYSCTYGSFTDYVNGTLTRQAQASHTGGEANCTTGATCANLCKR